MSYKKHLNEMKPETKDILISLYRKKLISFDVEHTSYVIDPIVVNLLGELIDAFRSEKSVSLLVNFQSIFSECMLALILIMIIS